MKIIKSIDKKHPLSFLVCGKKDEQEISDQDIDTFLSNLKRLFPRIQKYKNEIDPIIKNNIDLISEAINLSETDRKILYFAILGDIDCYFRNFISFLGDKSAPEAYTIICQILEISLEDFINAVQKRPLTLILQFNTRPFGSRYPIYEMFEFDRDFFVRIVTPNKDQ